MKICWDNLEGVYLTKNGLLRSNNLKRSYHVKECVKCEEEFLTLLSKTIFCSKVCSNTGKDNPMYGKYGKKNHMYGRHHTEETKQKIREKRKLQIITEETKKKISRSLKDRKCSEETKEKLRVASTGRKHSKEIREKISNSLKGKSSLSGNEHPNWKGGYHGKNIPTFDAYAHQLDWCEEIRRNSEDIEVLEVKCTYCGRWFTPKLNLIFNRIQSLKGNYEGEQRFYCSDGCKKACPIFNKKPETLMREDAVRAGRLNWLELNREVQPELRQIVFERDDYTCQKCESTESLNCHHIYPVATDPLLSADVDNCITLCSDCHKEVHKQDGCKYGQLKICLE